MFETKNAEATKSSKKLFRPEILAPAGNFEKLKIAIRYGADAVYLAGKSYGLRAFSQNFSNEELEEAIDYAHARGVKVYLTLNILAHPYALSGVRRTIQYLATTKIDALIVSDPGIFRMVRQEAPHIELHISTQASVCNAEACRFWYEQGARRIVLARELSLKEIADIRKDIPEDLELEAFVHGAMCMAWSGRCLLSNYLCGRGANQGACAQPCRWKWTLKEEKREREALEAGLDPHQIDPDLEIEEDAEGSYLMSSKDLCMIEHIPEMVDAGISSFKIEGRMKGVFYAAMTTRVYREAVDSYLKDRENYKTDPNLKGELEAMVHRSSDTGFYFTNPKKNPQVNRTQSYFREATVVGEVLGYSKEYDALVCRQRNKLQVGDALDLLPPKLPKYSFEVGELLDEKGQSIQAMPHPMKQFYLRIKQPVPSELQTLLELHGDLQGENHPLYSGFLRRQGAQIR